MIRIYRKKIIAMIVFVTNFIILHLSRCVLTRYLEIIQTAPYKARSTDYCTIRRSVYMIISITLGETLTCLSWVKTFVENKVVSIYNAFSMKILADITLAFLFENQYLKG